MKQLLSAAVCAALMTGFGLLGGSVAQAEEPAGWGTIKGEIKYQGMAPAPEELKVDKDVAACLAKGKIYKEEWVVNPKNNGVKNVFVWLVDANGKKLPIHPSLQSLPKEVEIDQPCCKFEPHVVGVVQGQKLIIKNSAAIAHNVNYVGGKDNESGNVLLPAGGTKKLKELKASLLPMPIQCNIHPWMSGYVRVFSDPYYAISDADGKFTIKNAPAGEYQLIIWHEGAGWGPGGKMGQKITIKPNGETNLGKIEIKKED